MTTNISDKDYKALEGFHTELVAGNARATMKDIGASSNDLWKVPVDQIYILAGYNPRVGPRFEAKIEWLTAQILEFGFYPDKPLAGYVAIEDGKQVIYVQDGQSRLLAAREAIKQGAPITTLPMVLKDRSMSMYDLTVALVASNEGEPFGPMEKAALVKRFRVFGKTDGEIATIMRVSPAYVGQLATLAGAPKKIRDMVINEEISATNAIESMRKHGDKAGEVLGGAVDKAKASGKGKASAKDDAASAALARQKKFGPQLYTMIVSILEHKATVIPDGFQTDLDSLLFRIEKEDLGQKVAKVAKAKVAKVAKVKKAAA